MRPCSIVRLASYEKEPILPYGVVINRIGEHIGPYRVVYAGPRPCVITRSTVITYSSYCKVDVEELKENYLLTLDYKKFKEYLVYPKKVWKIIYKKYFRYLEKGDTPRENGVLLYGPPGTGKTSMMDMMTISLGLYSVEITPGILSPYVGEAEQNLKRKLIEAEQNEPSIVKIDDAEWLAQSREQLMSSKSDVEGRLSSSLLFFLFDKLPQWKRENRRILTVVATNLSPEFIDPALRRSGRLGKKPVFVPLPNYEAVYIMFLKHGVDKKIGSKKAEEYVKKLVNIGANMADVVEVIEEIKNDEEPDPDIESLTGRGYIRPVPEKLVEDVNYSSMEMIFKKKMFSSRYTRLYVPAPMSVIEPILVNYFLSFGKSTVLLIDERFFEEAMTTAETSSSVLLVDTDNTSDEVLKLVYKKSKVPVVFVGERYPPLLVKTIVSGFSDFVNLLGKQNVLKIVLSYYGINYTEKDIDELVTRLGTKYEEFLKELKYWAYGLDIRDIIDVI